MSNSLDDDFDLFLDVVFLDQDGLSVGPDLGTNCLQRLSADHKVAASKERVKYNNKKNIKDQSHLLLTPQH